MYPSFTDVILTIVFQRGYEKHATVQHIQSTNTCIFQNNTLYSIVECFVLKMTLLWYEDVIPLFTFLCNLVFSSYNSIAIHCSVDILISLYMPNTGNTFVLSILSFQ